MKMAPGDQTAPHRSKDFSDEFPEQATKQHLIDHVWWWRYQDNLEQAKKIFPPWEGETHQITGVMLNCLRNYLEPSAWFYEFRARYNGRYEWDFGCPWVRCTDQQMSTLSCLVPSTYPSQFLLDLQRKEDCWVEFQTPFNLRLNDQTLVRDFLARVSKERERRAISPPKRQGGVRRRKLSWMSVEAMDIRHYNLGLLESAERGRLSKDLQRYVKMCQNLGLAP